MNIVIRAYLDGVVIMLLCLGVLYGNAMARGLGTEEDEIEDFKTVVSVALGWPGLAMGWIAYGLTKLWKTRNDIPTPSTPYSYTVTAEYEDGRRVGAEHGPVTVTPAPLSPASKFVVYRTPPRDGAGNVIPTE
jgi:hypothetical protein